MNVLANPKGKCWALESEFLEAWAIFGHKFLKQGCCRHLFQAVDLSKTNNEATMKQQKWWREKLMNVLTIGSFI